MITFCTRSPSQKVCLSVPADQESNRGGACGRSLLAPTVSSFRKESTDGVSRFERRLKMTVVLSLVLLFWEAPEGESMGLKMEGGGSKPLLCLPSPLPSPCSSNVTSSVSELSCALWIPVERRISSSYCHRGHKGSWCHLVLGVNNIVWVLGCLSSLFPSLPPSLKCAQSADSQIVCLITRSGDILLGKHLLAPLLCTHGAVHSLVAKGKQRLDVLCKWPR